MALTEEELDLAPLDAVLDELDGQKGAIIPALQKAQAIFGYLPARVIKHIAKRLHVSETQVYGVATFYAQFYLARQGRHSVRCCDGTACHVRGAPKVIQALENDLAIRAGETTDDYRVTLEVVYCLGSCGLAPVAVIDGHVVGRLVPDKAVQMVRQLE
ncbi:MAG: NAD(P)H-dependent oxidoreductase subunit E [Chloroflexi bacterium]|nr:NAD(P)H-dependent oxidoreductase subunit E [Chloroflexota bacterium]